MTRLILAIKWLYRLFDYKEPEFDFSKVDHNTHCSACGVLLIGSDKVIRTHDVFTVHANPKCVGDLCLMHNLTIRSKRARRYR